jgi:hypothetical protein
MSRQWIRRFGTERPVSSTATSAFAPRPFAPRPSPSAGREAAAAAEPPLHTLPLQAKATAREPARQEPAEILPIEGFSPSEPMLQFTLLDARRWVKVNTARSGYPAGWSKIPRKVQIEDYIAARKDGWESLQAAYEKEAEVDDEVPQAPEAHLERQRNPKRRTPPPIHREESELAAPSKKVKGKAEAEEEPADEHLEDEEEKKGDDEAATVRQIFLDVMGRLNVRDDLSKAIVADLDLSGYEPSGLQFLRRSSHKEIASCFDTARRLFELVGDPGSDASNTWSTKVPMGTALPRLVADIQAHRGSDCIYRCGIAGVAHGFTIILQGGRADLIQGFAGAGGESLAENLESGKAGYTIEELITHLTQLLDRDPNTTLAAQNELFSGSVDIEKIRRSDAEALEKARGDEDLTEGDADDQSDSTYLFFYRNLRKDAFQFERRGLYSQEQLQQRIAAKVQANLRILGRRR